MTNIAFQKVTLNGTHRGIGTYYGISVFLLSNLLFHFYCTSETQCWILCFFKHEYFVLGIICAFWFLPSKIKILIEWKKQKSSSSLSRQLMTPSRIPRREPSMTATERASCEEKVSPPEGLLPALHLDFIGFMRQFVVVVLFACFCYDFYCNKCIHLLYFQEYLIV